MILGLQKEVALFVVLVVCAIICAADPEEGRSLGLFQPRGQSVHYERYGGGGGGLFGKYSGYDYESYTVNGGGYGKPFGYFGPGFGHGFGYGFGPGFGPGFGNKFNPGFGYPYYPGFGYGFGPGFGPGLAPGFGPGFGYFK